MNVAEQLQTIARDTLDHEGPMPEGDLAEHFDSVERMALVVAIEDHFEIAFDPDDEERVATFADVEALVHAKLGQKGD
jgi:acyl carrier protein